MAMDKKSLFYLLLGASGLFLVVFAQYLGSISGQRVVLVSTTFENGSLAYLGDISINTSALDPEDGIYLKVRNRLSDLLQMVNGTSKNVRRVASGKFKKGFYYNRDTMALINDDNLLTNPNIVQSSPLYTLSKVSSIDSSFARQSDSTSAPSKNAGDVTSNANIKERSNAAEINGPDSPGRYAMNDSCVSRNTGLEDILCMVTIKSLDTNFYMFTYNMLCSF
ncbi:hypothetical protein DPMN_072019 [Dreissena polymorpha]|uniref:Uncharacterized protein n=1 Tax=Dreissena polymorpha TaxID=45954 RepID=A0A9D4BWN0_DREPO|nr:hypothetical protein DPMN_072019 [Dreissena polymorpha]